MFVDLTRIPASSPLILFLLAPLILTSGALGIEIFSDGVDLPETISLAPPGYGDVAGQLLIPDPGPANADKTVSTDNSNVWALPLTGGEPENFIGVPALPGFTAGFRGGVFLPAEFEQVGGQFLVTGRAALTTYDENGTENILFQPSDFAAQLGFVPVRITTPIIAPDSFGSLSGHVLVSYQKVGRFLRARDDQGDLVDAVQLDFLSRGGIFAVSPDTAARHVVTPSDPRNDPDFMVSISEPFGLAFAPENFGSYSNALLVSDSDSTNIIAVDPDGKYELFGRVPFVGDEDGLRQMAFSPTTFGDLEELLFVSVAAGQRTSGAVYTLNESGQIVGRLQVPPAMGTIDPRGLLFSDDNSLLVGDAVGRILRVTTDDFFQAGDATRDYVFDQDDIVRVLQGGKYRTGRSATWGEGDFNGDDIFDQDDIAASLRTGVYRTGSYLAITSHAVAGDGVSVQSDIDSVYISVPEPSSLALFSLAIFAVALAGSGPMPSTLSGIALATGAGRDIFPRKTGR